MADTEEKEQQQQSSNSHESEAGEGGGGGGHDELTRSIANNTPYEDLPRDLRRRFGTKAEWKKAVLEYALSHQLRFKRSLVCKVVAEELAYYERLLQYSKDHFMLYPYHLADVMVLKCKTTAYQYYFDILSHMLQTDRSYDALPNYTASDCLQLLGIGRNEYIDLVTKMKSGKGLFRRRVNPKVLLPQQPLVPEKMEYWWRVGVGHVLESTVKELTPAEKATLDRVIERGPTQAGALDRDIVINLYQKQLFYLDVPIEDDAYIVVPPLENFVMNRVLGDYLETLLYQIFVSIDQNTTVRELADVLQIDLQQVKDAVSMYCRLGFARKKAPPVARDGLHKSWLKAQGQHQQDLLSSGALASLPTPSSQHDRHSGSRSLSPTSSLANTEDSKTTHARTPRIAFLFDSTLAAFLMMGNLSPGLKKHAVTLFEAGKLSDETVLELISELELTETLMDGHAQEYSNHAIALRQTLKSLRKNARLFTTNHQQPSAASSTLEKTGAGVDLVRFESLASLARDIQRRVLSRNYVALVSMAPLSPDVRSITGALDIPMLGPPRSEFTSPWFKLFLYSTVLSGPESLFLTAGTVLTQLPASLRKYSQVLLTTWKHEPTITSTASLLLTLNDALAQGPVFVQGVSRSGSTCRLVHVPCTAPSCDYVSALLSSAATNGGGDGTGVAEMGSDLIDLEGASSTDAHAAVAQQPSHLTQTTQPHPRQHYGSATKRHGDSLPNDVSPLLVGARSKNAPVLTEEAAAQLPALARREYAQCVCRPWSVAAETEADTAQQRRVRGLAGVQLPQGAKGAESKGGTEAAAVDGSSSSGSGGTGEGGSHDSEQEGDTLSYLDAVTRLLGSKEMQHVRRRLHLHNRAGYITLVQTTTPGASTAGAAEEEEEEASSGVAKKRCARVVFAGHMQEGDDDGQDVGHRGEGKEGRSGEQGGRSVGGDDGEGGGDLIHLESTSDEAQQAQLPTQGRATVPGIGHVLADVVGGVPPPRSGGNDQEEEQPGRRQQREDVGAHGESGQTARDERSSRDGGCTTFQFLDVHFGVPLFDERLNAALCLSMEDHALFSASNLESICSRQREVTASLRRFIEDHKGCVEDTDPHQPHPALWPLPMSHLHFDGTAVREFNIV